MSVRNDFKRKVLRRIKDELPTDFPIRWPNHPKEKFIGLPEWADVLIQHAPSTIVSHGGKNQKRYSNKGTIIVRVMLPVDEGDKRGDEIAIMLYAMFQNRAIDGIDSRFHPVTVREAGNDDDGRYNVLLCEAVFEYREIK